MTSPVDTLKALVVEMRETERELRVEDRSVGIWPDNDTADIVKEWRERTDAAIAALSGGEAEPVAWRIQWSETIPGDYELTYSRKRVEGAAALANPPRIEPLYTTPRIPDGKEPVAWRVPTPYGVGYNFASEEVMRDMADWLVLRPWEGDDPEQQEWIISGTPAAPGDEGRGDG